MKKKFRVILFYLTVLFLAAVPRGFAQEDSSASSGAPASSYEENLRRWQNMTEDQREAIRQKVRAMAPQQKEAVLEKAKEFKQLPAEDQRRIRRNFMEFEQWSPEKRREIRSLYDRFQKMPEERRQEMRRQFRPEKRDAEGGLRPDRFNAGGERPSGTIRGGGRASRMRF